VANWHGKIQSNIYLILEKSDYREIWMGRNEGKVDLKSRSD